MREDILRVLKKIWRGKVKTQGQSIDLDQTLISCKIREEKGEKNIKNIFLETREKEENFDINIVIFREELDSL